MTRWLCRECKKPIELHYNHVGPDCDGGNCTGTFQHVITRRSPRALFKCRLVHATLQHHQVCKAAE